MSEAQVQELIRQAIQAERVRIADIFRNVQAEFRNWNGDHQFDFEASCQHIADAIENPIS